MRTLVLRLPRMRGEDVTHYQTMIASLGYDIGTWGANKDGIDGKYGKDCASATKDFQRANGLAVDGKVGAQTWPALEAAYAAQSSDVSQMLQLWGFGDMIASFGERHAVRQYQAAMGLGVDGIAGPKTKAALSGTPILPRISEDELRCQCGTKHSPAYCTGYPMGKGSGAGVLLLAELVMREVDKAYPGTVYYVANAAHPTPSRAIAGGYRCTRWNKERGGATGSQHKACQAIDLYGQCGGVADSVIRQKIEDVAKQLNTKGGVGYGARYIVHLDTRGVRARWKY